MTSTFVFFLGFFYTGWFLHFTPLACFAAAVVLGGIAYNLADAAEEKEKRRWARLAQELRGKDHCWIKLKQDEEAWLAKIVPGSVRDHGVEVTYPEGRWPDMEFTIEFSKIERLGDPCQRLEFQGPKDNLASPDGAQVHKGSE